MINIDTAAPDVNLETNGKTIKLSDLRGKNTVLYFYPKDMTSGWTNEAVDFNEHLNDFEKLDTVVVGVSKDSLESHNKFMEKNNLKFDLASDVDLEVIKAFDVWKEKNMYGKKTMGVERTTFIIDKQGIVRKIYSKVKVNGHVERVLKDIEEMQE